MRHRERDRDTRQRRSRHTTGSPNQDSILGPWDKALSPTHMLNC